MIEGFLAAFAAVFIAELPDKTMEASQVLTTRFHRPFAVWVGVCTAFAMHVVLAVSIGSVLKRLPDTPVKLAVAALFLIGGFLLLRGGGDEEADDTGAADAVALFRTVAVTAASVVGLAEFGDLTQLATAGLATQYSAPVAVALGAWCALAAVAGLAVTAGKWITQHVPLHIVQRVAGVLFVGFGVFTAATVLV